MVDRLQAGPSSIWMSRVVDTLMHARKRASFVDGESGGSKQQKFLPAAGLL